MSLELPLPLFAWQPLPGAPDSWAAFLAAWGLAASVGGIFRSGDKETGVLLVHTLQAGRGGVSVLLGYGVQELEDWFPPECGG